MHLVFRGLILWNVQKVKGVSDLISDFFVDLHRAHTSYVERETAPIAEPAILAPGKYRDPLQIHYKEKTAVGCHATCKLNTKLCCRPGRITWKTNLTLLLITQKNDKWC